MKDKSKTEYTPVKKYTVTEEYSNTRLDNCLISKLKNLPKSKIYSIIRKGEVRVNGSRCKHDKRLKEGDIIRIPPYNLEKKNSFLPSNSLVDILKKNIIYNQENILIINKPVGLASHGGSGISLGLIEAIRQIDKEYKNAHLVHRLDRETSGCIVLALKRSVLRNLNEEFREGRVEKKYLAVVKGEWPGNLNLVKSNLKKNILRSGEREVQIHSDGKESKTRFNLVKKNKDLSLIECELVTGRTHQIRVQTSNLGYPILGDKKYGDSVINNKFKQKGLNRMLLHAKSITFPKFQIFCKSQEPPIFKKIMSNS